MLSPSPLIPWFNVLTKKDKVEEVMKKHLKLFEIANSALKKSRLGNNFECGLCNGSYYDECFRQLNVKSSGNFSWEGQFDPSFIFQEELN